MGRQPGSGRTCPVMALQARAVHCGGQWLWPSGSALCMGLSNGPSSSSAPLPLSLYRPPGAAVDQPGPTGMVGRQAANRRRSQAALH